MDITEILWQICFKTVALLSLKLFFKGIIQNKNRHFSETPVALCRKLSFYSNNLYEQNCNPSLNDVTCKNDPKIEAQHKP